MPVIGLLSAGARGPLRSQIAAFEEGLKSKAIQLAARMAASILSPRLCFDRVGADYPTSVRR
jgi:hypothetical protein